MNETNEAELKPVRCWAVLDEHGQINPFGLYDIAPEKCSDKIGTNSIEVEIRPWNTRHQAPAAVEALETPYVCPEFPAMTALTEGLQQLSTVEMLRAEIAALKEAILNIGQSAANAQSCPSDNECHQDCWEGLWDRIKEAEALAKMEE